MKRILALMSVSVLIHFAHANDNIDSILEIDRINYDPLYSPTHPLTAEEIISQMYTQSYTGGSTTDTYIRCYYSSPNGSGANLSTNYIWARNHDNSYYKLNGYWYSNVQWKNMFYTNKSVTELRNLCKNSLEREAKGVLIEYYAANNTLSFDHTIWHNTTDVSDLQFDRLIAFGDSLSDTHNIYNALQWRFPNRDSWFFGRFSNGPIWIEYLANSLDIPYYSWAVGGAIAGDTGFATSDLLGQVDSFKKYNEIAVGHNLNKTLFTIWAGSNDFTNDKPIKDAIANTEHAIKRLVELGAKNILILNLPDITDTPIFDIRQDGESVRGNVLEFNRLLNELIRNISNSKNDLNLIIFDTFSQFAQIKQNPEKFNMLNVDDSCLNINSSSSLNYINAQIKRTKCKDPNTFVFWDTLHPTTAAHKIISDNIISLLGK